MSDRVDEVEAALHFDECNLTFLVLRANQLEV